MDARYTLARESIPSDSRAVTRERRARPARSAAAPARQPPRRAKTAGPAALLQSRLAAGNAAVSRWVAGGRRPVAARGGANLEHSAAWGKEEAECGNFRRDRTFTPPDGKTGVIVQKITRTFDVTRLDTGAKIDGAQIDTYCTEPGSAPHATDTQYWEAWDVTKAGETHDDAWQLCSIAPDPATLPPDGNGKPDFRNTTRGTFAMRGTAGFYDGITASSLGMRRGAVGCAGGLPSATGDPAPAGQVGPAVVYGLDVVWDSSVQDRRKKPGVVSKVTEV